MSNIKSPKKLIEVSLPLDNINIHAAREKSIRRGHPSTLHLWWARRPLAAARAVLFAQLVNDPGGERGYKSGLTKDQAAKKREELFDIIRDLVQWENVNNEKVLNRARAAIMDSWRETCELNKGIPGFDPKNLPAFHDPFAGGGSIPLEAQRLGLDSYASDLNPVAVLINKAMIEIPSRFANMTPIGPVPKGEKKLIEEFVGAQGLAEDVRRYGYWLREEAKKRIGNLYPEVEITKDMVNSRPDLKPYLGQKLTVIAWLWARTVKSPNPRYSHIDVPLVSSFILSKNKGKEAYVQPVIEDDAYHFEVRVGKPPKEAENGTKLARGAKFKCVMSDVPIDPDYIKSECFNGRGSQKLMAVVLEGSNGRLYISPEDSMVEIAESCKPAWKPTAKLSEDKRAFWTPSYGLVNYGDLFTPRQLTALNTFSELILEARKKVIADAKAAGMSDDGKGLEEDGVSATAYGDAIATYLAFAVDKCTNLNSTITSWMGDRGAFRETFARQAIPMSWDYAEANLFSNSGGNFITPLLKICDAIKYSPSHIKQGRSVQNDAQTQTISNNKIVSTDPPYYDNIGYADLSDFFYVWLRKNLKPIYPSLFATMATPKDEELIAAPYRHGSKEKSEEFFLNGMTKAMHNLAQQIHPAFPITIYYAFKASETSSDGVSNTGWETFLEALIQAGFVITGTWPMRTEGSGRLIANGTNALASSIVLVCRRRDEDAKITSRRNFRQELDEALPKALSDMTDGACIAPVDLNQAAIGPGMELFSKYKSVIKPDGTPLTVHEAMIEINNRLTQFLNPDDESLDPITNFCKVWFEEYRWDVGPYGEAEKLARPKQTSVETVRDSGVATAKGGKVQLLRWQDYPENYDPEKDRICSAWETCHHLIRLLMTHGVDAAGKLLSKLTPYADGACQLAYRQYSLCEKFGLSEEAGNYNDLLVNWRSILESSDKVSAVDQQQTLI